MKLTFNQKVNKELKKNESPYVALKLQWTKQERIKTRLICAVSLFFCFESNGLYTLQQ